VEDRDFLHWTVIGSGRTGVRGSDTPEGFTPEILWWLRFEIAKGRSPKVDDIIDMEANAWCQIWNSGYRALWRKAEGESTEVPKEISIVDQEEVERH
jgi:hypothetical protein